MAKSSINFQKVSSHSFFHNDRSEKIQAETVHPQFSHLNNCNTDSKTAKKNFDEFYKIATSKVTGRTRRAAKKNTLVEAAVNIKPNTTMEDLENLSKFIEKRFGFTALQISIHQDEGHFEGEKFITNHHAHITFFTLNLENGRQNFRRELIKKDDLRELQTATAKILNMERGIDKRITKKERLSHKDHKYFKKIEDDFKKEIKFLREDLKELGAIRADYAELEAINKKLKEELKSKDFDLNVLRKKYLEKAKELVKKVQDDANEKLKNAKNLIDSQKDEIEKLKEEAYIEIDGEMHSFRKISENFFEENEELKNENEKLKNENEKLKEELEVRRKINLSGGSIDAAAILKEEKEIEHSYTQINSEKSEFNIS